MVPDRGARPVSTGEPRPSTARKRDAHIVGTEMAFADWLLPDAGVGAGVVRER